MEEKVEAKKQSKKIKKGFIIIPIIIIVLAIAVFTFWEIYTDKTYKLEEITQFSYFKLYENEKYGVIDNKRKYYNRAKI